MDTQVQEFINRYAQWCMQEAQEEVDSGYKRLEHVRVGITKLYLEHALSMDVHTRRILATAVVKCTLRYGLQLYDIELNDEEKKAHNQYNEAWDRYISYDSWKLNQEIEHNSIPRRGVSNKIREIMKPDFGLCEKQGGGVIAFEKNMPYCHLVVEVDLGGRGHRVDYSTRVFTADKKTQIIEHTSLCEWLGLATTEWSGVYEGEEEKVASCILDWNLYLCEEMNRIGQDVFGNHGDH